MANAIPRNPNPEKDTVGVSILGKGVEVQRGLTISNMAFLLRVYLDAYIKSKENLVIKDVPFNPLDAQVQLDYNLCLTMTDMNVDGSDKFNLDNLYASDMLHKIKSSIHNWNDFMELLEHYRSLVVDNTYSIKGLLDSFVDIKNIDMDKVNEIGNAVKKAKKEVAENKTFEKLMNEGKEYVPNENSETLS